MRDRDSERNGSFGLQYVQPLSEAERKVRAEAAAAEIEGHREFDKARWLALPLLNEAELPKWCSAGSDLWSERRPVAFTVRSIADAILKGADHLALIIRPTPG